MKKFNNFISIGSNNLSKLLKEITENSTVKVTVYKENSKKTFIIVPNISCVKNRFGREIKITVADNEELGKLLNGIEIVTKAKMREMDQGREVEAGRGETNVNQEEVIILKSPPLCGKVFEFLTENQGFFSNETSHLCATLQRSRFYATDGQTANSMHLLPISQFSREALVTSGSSYFPKMTRSEQQNVGLYPKILSDVKDFNDFINQDEVDPSRKRISENSELVKNMKLDNRNSEFESCLSEIFYDSLSEQIVIPESPKMTKNSKSSPAVLEVHEFCSDLQPKVKKSSVLLLTESRFKKFETTFARLQAKNKIKTIEPLLNEFDHKNEIIDKLEDKFVDQLKQMKNTFKKKNVIVMNFELPRNLADELIIGANSSENEKKLNISSDISKTYIDSLKLKFDTTKRRRNCGNLVVVNDQIFKMSVNMNETKNRNILTDDNKSCMFLNNALYKEIEKETMTTILNRRYSTTENQEGGEMNNASDELKLKQNLPNVSHRGYTEIPLDNLIAAVAEKKQNDYVVRSKVIREVYEHYEKILENTKILDPPKKNSELTDAPKNEPILKKKINKEMTQVPSKKIVNRNNEIRLEALRKNRIEGREMLETTSENQHIQYEQDKDIQQPETLKTEIENLNRQNKTLDMKSRIPVKTVSSPKTIVNLAVDENEDHQINSKPQINLLENHEKLINRKQDSESKGAPKQNENLENITNSASSSSQKESINEKNGIEKSRLPRLVNTVKHTLKEKNETFLKLPEDKSENENSKIEEKSPDATKSPTVRKEIEQFINVNKVTEQNVSSKDTLVFKERENAEVNIPDNIESPNHKQLQFFQGMVEKPTKTMRKIVKPGIENTQTIVDKMVQEMEEAASRPKIIRRDQGTFVVIEPKTMSNKATQRRTQKDAFTSEVITDYKKKTSTNKTLLNQNEYLSRLQKMYPRNQPDVTKKAKLLASERKLKRGRGEGTKEEKYFINKRNSLVSDRNGNEIFENSVIEDNGRKPQAQLKSSSTKEINTTRTKKKSENAETFRIKKMATDQIEKKDIRKENKSSTLGSAPNMIHCYKITDIEKGRNRNIKDENNIFEEQTTKQKIRSEKEKVSAEANSVTKQTLTNIPEIESTTMEKQIKKNANVMDAKSDHHVMENGETVEEKAQQIEGKNEAIGEERTRTEADSEAKKASQIEELQMVTDISETDSKIILNAMKNNADVTDETNSHNSTEATNLKGEQARKIEEEIERDKEILRAEEYSKAKGTMQEEKEEQMVANTIELKSQTTDFTLLENDSNLKGEEARNIREESTALGKKEIIMAKDNLKVTKPIQLEKENQPIINTSDMDSRTIENIFRGNDGAIDQTDDCAILEGTESLKEDEEKIASNETHLETKTAKQTEGVQKISTNTLETDSKLIADVMKGTDYVKDETRGSMMELPKKEAKSDDRNLIVHEKFETVESPDPSESKEPTFEKTKIKTSGIEKHQEKAENVEVKNISLNLDSSANIEDIKYLTETREANAIDTPSASELKDSTLKYFDESKDFTSTEQMSDIAKNSENVIKNDTSNVESKGENLSLSKLTKNSTESFENSKLLKIDIFRGPTEEQINVADKGEKKKTSPILQTKSSIPQCYKQPKLECAEKAIETVNNSKDASVSVHEITKGIENFAIESISQNVTNQNDVLKKSASENVIIIKAAKKESEETIESALGITKPFLEQIQSKMLNFVTKSSKSKVKIPNFSFRSHAVKKCKEITALLKRSHEKVLVNNTVGLVKICQRAKMMNRFSRTKLLSKRLNANTPKTTNALLNATADKSRQSQAKKVKGKTARPEGLVKSAIENKVTSKMKSLTKTQANIGKRPGNANVDKIPHTPMNQNDTKQISKLEQNKQEFAPPSPSNSELDKDSIGSMFAEIVASALVKCGKVDEEPKQYSDSEKEFTNIMDMAQDVKTKIQQVEICVTDGDTTERNSDKEESRDPNEFMIQEGDVRKLSLNVQLKENKKSLGDQYKCNIALILDSVISCEEGQTNLPPMTSKTSESLTEAMKKTSEEVLSTANIHEVEKSFLDEDPEKEKLISLKEYNKDIPHENGEATMMMKKISDTEFTTTVNRMPLITNEMRKLSQEKIQQEQNSSDSVIRDKINKVNENLVSTDDNNDISKRALIQLSYVEKNTTNNITTRESGTQEAVNSNENNVVPITDKSKKDDQKGILKVEDEIKGNSVEFLHTRKYSADAAGKFSFKNFSGNVLQNNKNTREDQNEHVTTINNNEKDTVTIASNIVTIGDVGDVRGLKKNLETRDINKNELSLAVSNSEVPLHRGRNDIYNNSELNLPTSSHEKNDIEKKKDDEFCTLNRKNRNSAMKYLSFSDEYSRNTLDIFPEVFLTPFSSNTDLTKELEQCNDDNEENFGVFRNLSHRSQAPSGICKVIHIATNEEARKNENHMNDTNDIRSSCRANDFPNSKICREKEKIILKDTRNHEYLKQRIESISREKLTNDSAECSTSINELKGYTNSHNTKITNSKSVEGIFPDWKKYNERKEDLKDAFADLEKMGNSIKQPIHNENSTEKCSTDIPDRKFFKNPRRDFTTKHPFVFKNRSAQNLNQKYRTLGTKNDVGQEKDEELLDSEKSIDKKTIESNTPSYKNSFYHELVRKSEMNEMKNEGAKKVEKTPYKPTFYIFNAERNSSVPDIKKIPSDWKSNMEGYVEDETETTQVKNVPPKNLSNDNEASVLSVFDEIEELRKIDSKESRTQKTFENAERTKPKDQQISRNQSINVSQKRNEKTKKIIDNSSTIQGDIQTTRMEENKIEKLNSPTALEKKKKNASVAILKEFKYDPLSMEDLQMKPRQRMFDKKFASVGTDDKINSKPQISKRPDEVLSKPKILEKFAKIDHEPDSPIYKIRRDLKFDMSTKRICKNDSSDKQKPRLGSTTPKTKGLALQEHIAKKTTSTKHEQQRPKSKKMIFKFTPSKELYSPLTKAKYDELKQIFLKNPKKFLVSAAEMMDKNQYLSFLLELKSRKEIKNFSWKKICDGLSSTLSFSNCDLSKVRKGEKTLTKVKSSVPEEVARSKSKKEIKEFRKESTNMEHKLSAFRKDKKKEKFMGTNEKLARQNFSSSKTASAKHIKALSYSGDRAKKNVVDMEIDSKKIKNSNLKSPKGDKMLRNDNAQASRNRRNLSSQYTESPTFKSSSLPYTMKKFLETPDVIQDTHNKKDVKNINSATNFQKIFVLGEEIKLTKLKNAKVFRELPKDHTKFDILGGNGGIDLSSGTYQDLKDFVACQKSWKNSSKPLITKRADSYEKHTENERDDRIPEDDIFYETQMPDADEEKRLLESESNRENNSQQPYNSNEDIEHEILPTVHKKEPTENFEFAHETDSKKESNKDIYFGSSENMEKDNDCMKCSTGDNYIEEIKYETISENAVQGMPKSEHSEELDQCNIDVVFRKTLPDPPDRRDESSPTAIPECEFSLVADNFERDNLSDAASDCSDPIFSLGIAIEERKNIVKNSIERKSCEEEMLTRNALFDDISKSTEKLKIGPKHIGHINFQSRRKFENPLNKLIPKNTLTGSGTNVKNRQESNSGSTINTDENSRRIRVIRTKSFSEVLKNDPNLLKRLREQKQVPPYVTPRRIGEVPRKFEYRYHDFRKKTDVDGKFVPRILQQRKKDFIDKCKDLMLPKKSTVSEAQHNSTEEGSEQMKPKILSKIWEKMNYFKEPTDPLDSEEVDTKDTDPSSRTRRSFCDTLYLKSKFGSWRFVHTKMEQIDEDELMTWVQEHPGTPMNKTRSENTKEKDDEKQNVIHVPWTSVRTKVEREN